MGSFFEKVKRGDIIGPRKRSFTLDGWGAAFKSNDSNGPLDTALFSSGKLISAKLAAVRRTADQSSLSRLSTGTRIQAFVATANHQFEAFEVHMRRHFESANENGSLQIRGLASAQVTLIDGVSYNLEAAFTSMLDGIAIPIRVALSSRSDATDTGLDAVEWGDVMLEVNLGILYDQVENLWEDCIWNTYVLVPREEMIVAVPTEKSAKLISYAAASRRIALGIESRSYSVRTKEQAKARKLKLKFKEVRSITTDGLNQRIELGSKGFDSQSMPSLIALRTMASPPYYESLLDEPQPKLAGATLSQLLDGWMVVSQAAQCLWQATSPARNATQPVDPKGLSDLSKYVPYFTVDALVTAIHSATGIEQTKAQAIVEFLTFNGKGLQEFWTQPLVPADDSTKLYPIFGTIAAPPNLRFTLETWMAQLQVKLDQRGPAFETYLREAVVDSAVRSPLLSQVAKVASSDFTFKCSDGSFGQIDVLFCVGSSVFVIEAKCILEPTVSSTIGTHRAAISRAAEQAKVRVKLIEEHRDEFIAQTERFGWHLPATFNVYPLVAVSTVAHVGFPFDGVPVVDEYVLNKFFEGGYESVALQGKDLSVVQRVHHPFYASVSEAEGCAVGYFEEPPQLQQYNTGHELRTYPIHAASKDDWHGLAIDFD